MLQYQPSKHLAVDSFWRATAILHVPTIVNSAVRSAKAFKCCPKTGKEPRASGLLAGLQNVTQSVRRLELTPRLLNTAAWRKADQPNMSVANVSQDQVAVRFGNRRSNSHLLTPTSLQSLLLVVHSASFALPVQIAIHESITSHQACIAPTAPIQACSYL